MAEKKLSEELEFCLQSDGCYGCEYYDVEIKSTCRSLLQKAYEKIKEYEEMEDRKNGEID